MAATALAKAFRRPRANLRADRKGETRLPDCLIAAAATPAIPIHAVTPATLDAFLAEAGASVAGWVAESGFSAAASGSGVSHSVGLPAVGDLRPDPTGR